MLPTPIHPDLPPSVYPPSEDTYLLLDTLSSPSETTFLSRRFPLSTPTPILIEPGSGSGTIIAFLVAHSLTILGRPDVIALATDANPDASGVVGKTVLVTLDDVKPKGNGLFAACLRADLVTPIRDGCADLVVFNPPYVPTSEVPAVPHDSGSAEDGIERRDVDYAEESRRAELAYSGGKDGMEVTDRFLVELRRVLSPRGVAYLLLCARNLPDRVVERIRSWREDTVVSKDEIEGDGSTSSAWSADIVGSTGRTGGFEKLVVVRTWRI